MNKINVMVAGLPGKMATLVAEAVESQEDMTLHAFALSEDSEDIMTISLSGKTEKVELVPLANHLRILKQGRKVIDIVVDFTQPQLINDNAQRYCRSDVGIPFVMGTTGGDRELLKARVEGSDISAVIATNMAVPVVMFQEMIRFAAASFPHSLDGFKLVIRESHQAAKPDPSGTAVSLLESFAELGMPLKKEQIIMVRDPAVQELMGVPTEHLGGHGYHTYSLLSPDNMVLLQFTHNIQGRSVYVDGTLKAIRFLAKHKKEKGKVFSMVDVLHG